MYGEEEEEEIPPTIEEVSGGIPIRRASASPRPFRLSPIQNSSSSGDEYHSGLMGSTPPSSAGRLKKTSRRSQKQQKSSKKSSPGHVTFRHHLAENYRSSPKARTVSMDLANPIGHEIKEQTTPRRHTLYDVSDPIRMAESITSKNKRKNQDKERQRERKDKTSRRIDLNSSHSKTPHLSDIQPSYSLIDNIGVSQSLSAAMLNTSTSTMHQLERSHSEVHLSLVNSTSQSIHCPPDRKQFYRNFTKKLAVISKRQQQQQTHIPRQHSENLDAKDPFGPLKAELWLEIRSKFNGISMEDQMDQDDEMHSKTSCILSHIMNYKFTPSPSKETIDDFRGTEEYEVIQSLPSGLNLPKLDNERTPLASITTLEYEDEELTTLTQQESTESDTSSCPTITTDNFLLPEQVEALHEVDSILEDLQKFESLYPCTGKIEDDRYRCSKFKRRRDAIVLWSKITRGLADNLVHLSKWLGMPVNPFPHSQSPTDQPLTMQPLPLSSGETSQSTDINPEESLTFSAISSSLRTQSSVFSTSSSSTNYSRTTLQRMFSSAHASSLEDDRHSSHGVYSRFVNQTLKKEGLQYLIEKLLQFISPILDFAEEAMKVYPYSPDEETKEEQPERQPLLRSYLPANNSDKPFKRATSTAPRCWMDEFASMNLPSFSEIYLQLTRVPLDIMNECMILRTAHSGGIPTNYSVGKLVREFHIALKKAVKVRRFYRRKVHVLTYNNPGGLDMLDADMELFEENLQSILQLYFTYVEHYLRSSGTHRNLMESEWERAKLICTDISSGEVEAGLRFCHIALQIVENLEDDFKRRIDECCDKLHESSDTLDDTDDQKKIAFMELCREFKTTIQDVRENSMKALGFARTLMNDLEIAAELSICCPKEQLLDLLAESEHCQVIIPHSQSCMSCMLFVPQTIADDHYMIQQLLGVSFGRPTNIVDDEDEIDASAGVIDDDIAHDIPKNSYISDKKYLLVIKFDMKELQPHWKGRNINLTLSAETIVSISEMQVEGIKLIVDDSVCLEDNLMTFITSMSSSVEVTNKKTSSHHSVSERINELKITLCRFGHVIIDIVQRINSNLSVEEINEREDLLQHYQPTMQTCYNLGFEYIQDLARLFGDEYIHQKLGVEMLHFAIQWMIFVTTKCSRGHGKRPRWAVLGLEFILLACSPRMLATISHTKYENVKKQMERCLTHVIGEAPLRSSNDLESAATYSETTKAIKRRGRRKFPIRVLSVQHTLNHIREEDLMDISSADSSDVDSANDGPPTARDFSSQEFIASYYNSLDSPCLHDVTEEEKDVDCDKSTKLQSIQEQCEALEVRRDDELRKKRLIGRVTDRGGVSALELHKLADIKQSHFNWRRGRKLGEGQFGEVYECINTDKQEVHAVKMISMKEKSHIEIREILSEISVISNIRHPNIVQLHGVEIHNTDLFLFMEYCNQGTLWSAARQGLPERMIRFYTRDLLRAVYALHQKGIVHRDIKGANIFLSDNSVKLGDFGLSVQLQNLNKTTHQEVKNQRGTIPYMAPEVVLQKNMGMPVDIWSVGCVVVEMYTNKRPWFEFEDNAFAIMYQLGQGNHPNYPEDKMNGEMVEFLNLCFQMSPKDRAGANRLLDHPFVQILDEDDDGDDDII